jgi:RNA polymerase sigma-70 factor (ECF subfamily)
MAIAVPDAPTDAQLVARCRAGASDAFAPLVERHQEAVYATALRLVGDRDAAIEVANTAFFKAYRALDTVDLTRPLRPWLVRIASNEALNFLRARKGEQSHQVTGAAGEVALDSAAARDPTPEEDLLAAERRASVRRALAALPDQYRLVAVLRYLHDLSYAEIAEQTGLPSNTVGVYLLRARDRLRESLVAQGVTAHDLSR